MLKPTNDPLAVMRRQEMQASREARAALDAGGTEPFQAVRKLEAQITELRELVLRLPQNEGRNVTVDSWSVSGAWTTITSISIPRPEVMTRVVVSATSSVRAMGSGDLLAFGARLVVNGEASAEFKGAIQDSGVFTTSVSYPSFVREIASMTASNVTVQLQVNIAANPYEFDKLATLSVLAGFSTI